MTLIPGEESFWEFVGFMGRYGNFGLNDSGLIRINRWEHAIKGIAYWVQKERGK